MWGAKNQRQRKDKADIYNSREWKELRIAKLRSVNCRCEQCRKDGEALGIPDGYSSIATIVHHIHPIEDSHSKEEMRHWAFMWSNLLAVCPACHARIHRDQLKSNTSPVVKDRQEARQDRWADGLTRRFTTPKGDEGQPGDAGGPF